MKFNTAKEMLDYINDNNDLYSRKAEKYVFNYNESGSICTYDIDEDEAKELAKKAKKTPEYWAAFLGTGGKIFDDPSYECYEDEQMSNLECCEELIKYEDWVITKQYLGEPMDLTIQMPIELTQEDVDDIMCSALDVGITYWCKRAEVVEKEYFGEFASEQISRGGSLRLYDAESEECYILNLYNFLEGFKMWVAGGYEKPFGAISKGKVDCCNIDAVAADRIIQCAIFGEIIYG